MRLQPEIDAAYLGIVHDLVRYALGQVLAEIDHEQPVREW